MSGRAGPTAADFFYRGASGAAVTQPNLAATSLCGLAYHIGAYTAGFETLLALSDRFGTGKYIFVGVDAGRFYVDANGMGSGTHTAALPPTDTWFQWAAVFDTDPAAGNVQRCRIMWKLPGDAAWNGGSVQGNSGSAPTVPLRMLLGCDEWGSSAGLWALDNVRCYSVVKSDAFLLADVNSTTSTDPANLFGWWKLRAGADFLKDSTGAANGDAASNPRPLLIAGAAAAYTDSPLEAPADLTGAHATGVAAFQRWTGGGTAAAHAHAIGVAALPRWRGGGSAITRAVARGAAAFLRWTGSGAGVAQVHAAGRALFKRWRGGGTAGQPVPVDPATVGTRRRSAMGPLQIAIDNALQAHAGFRALVPADPAAGGGAAVYSLGTVPKRADGTEPAPYLELGNSSERSAGTFGRGGNENVETMTIVSPKAGGKPALAAILDAMLDALDGRRLVVGGHDMLRGRLELTTVYTDPDTESLRGVCSYTVRTLTQ